MSFHGVLYDVILSALGGNIWAIVPRLVLCPDKNISAILFAVETIDFRGGFSSSSCLRPSVYSSKARDFTHDLR